MRTRSLSIIAILLWVLTVVVAAILFVRGSTTRAPDGRLIVMLAPSQRDTVRTEMRGLLQSTQGIVHGMVSGDRGQIESAARASGMAAAADVSPALIAKLPLNFKKLGFATHRGFDAIARAAQNGASNAQLLDMLDTQLGRCTACHATYRLPP